MTLRWGILGTSMVARKFALGLRRLPKAALTCVASGARANAEAFARDFTVPGVADDAEDLARSPDVDVVYIATPPSLHRAHAITCMEQGKAVLVEKPFAATLRDAEAIAETAARTGVFCMEGMWTRFLPLLDDLRARLAAGEIGALRGFSGSFAAPNAPDPAQNLFRADRGGGALLHRGVYPLSLACHLMGPPVAQESLGTSGETGVDEDSLVILRHEGGALSSIASSLRSPAPNDFILTGTHGMIRVHAPIYRPFRMTITRTLVQGAPRLGDPRIEAFRESGLAQSAHQRLAGIVSLARGRKTHTVTRPYAGNGYHYEAAEVMARIAAGAAQSPLMPLADSLLVVGVMEKVRLKGSARAP